MKEMIMQQVKILEVFVIDGKKYLEGYALSELGVHVPREEKGDLFECSQERIDELVKEYTRAYPNIVIEQQENHKYDTKKTNNQVNNNYR